MTWWIASALGRTAALLAVLLLTIAPARATLDDAQLAALVMPPYQLGKRQGDSEVWTILTSGGAPAGYIFETRSLAPIPGFGGVPIDMLITLDRDGQFLDVTLLEQSEPVFVSGLGTAPLEDFLRQYRGRSVGESIVVGAADSRDARRQGSSHLMLDGVTKATASVRIANETILAAALQVARERMRGVGPRPVARPRADHDEALDWEGVIAQGVVRRLQVSEADLQAAFADSPWQSGAALQAADPGSTYLDLWVADVGPPAVARALLDAPTRDALRRRIDPGEEPVLLLATGRHRLIDADFVRNTTPERIALTQDGLPVTLRDADVEVGLAAGVPSFPQAMLLRVDRRLGFDPASPWTLAARVVREHGTFRPETEARDFTLTYRPQPRFYEAAAEASVGNMPAWRRTLADRSLDIGILAVFVGGLFWLLATRMRTLAAHPRLPEIRLAVLAVTLGFVGWWGQGQLSIVTLVAVLRSVAEGHSLGFLLYDPFSLLLWAVTLGSLVVWGRGLFCGWLCPFGALQEFTYRLGRLLHLPEPRLRPRFDLPLKRVKYAVLAVLAMATLTSTGATDALVEVEPFKTSITLMFDRGPPFAIYAAFWLALGLFVFKPFCRWLCPLGAALAGAGRVRRLDWIPRRVECGRPCQLCRVRCLYGAIEPDGRIDYDECFQCLDCVAIHDDPGRCVPEVLARRRGRRLTASLVRELAP